jgi:hypothetical protein
MAAEGELNEKTCTPNKTVVVFRKRHFEHFDKHPKTRGFEVKHSIIYTFL